MPNLNALEKELTSKQIRLSLINLESNIIGPIKSNFGPFGVIAVMRANFGNFQARLSCTKLL